MGLKKVLIRPLPEPPTPGCEGNPGLPPPVLGSPALEPQQVGLEGEGLKAGRKEWARAGMEQEYNLGWSGDRGRSWGKRESVRAKVWMRVDRFA